MYKSLIVGILALAYATFLNGCKTPRNSDSSLQGVKKGSANANIFSCYKIIDFETSSNLAFTTKLKNEAERLCITESPINLTLVDRSESEILKWAFEKIEPMRCPNCFTFIKSSSEYSASIAATPSSTSGFNVTLDTRGFGGKVKLKVEQIGCEGGVQNNGSANCGEPEPGSLGASCGSRGQKPCDVGLICAGASADDRPGRCLQPSPGSLGASCGSRGQKPCDAGLICVGAGADDRPGKCLQSQDPPRPAPKSGPDSRICTQAIVPLFYPPTGSCHRALNGCQAADYMDLGWRKLNADDECK